MKPTPEMVELARKLHDADYRQEIQEGDWCLTGKASVTPLLWQWKDKTLPKLIPIPSLSSCLVFIHDKVKSFAIVSPYETGGFKQKGWVCEWGGEPEYTEADTPEESVMMAMLKILEGKNE